MRCLVILTCLIACVGTIEAQDDKDVDAGVDGVVLMGLWQGLNNQRLCVTPSFLMAQRLGYAVVLPYWRLEFLGDNSDADRGLVPFSYLFKVDKLRELAARHGVTVIDSPARMPEDMLAVCLEQLGRHYDVPHDPIKTQAKFWHKVRCCLF